MKSKTKFDPKVIQQFFIEHVEKFVIGLVGALFVFFAYRSFLLTQYEAYDKKPEVLKKATDAALAKIASGPATKTAEKVATFLPYADIIDVARRIIDPAAYPMPARLNWKPIAPRRPREAPEVFAVEQLRAIPGRGALPKEGGESLGRRWICVTGLVPYKKQLAEYRVKFEGAAWNDPREDMPKYVGYFVQRAEVTPGGAGKPQWSKFTIFAPNTSADAAAEWGGRTADEIADSRFVHPKLTSPLPLLQDATWGNEVLSPPQIPLAEHREKDSDKTPQTGQPHIHAADDSGLHNVTLGTHGVDVPAENPLNNVGPPNPGSEQSNPGDEEARTPEYLLLRFFDFDVKPDKQYQYRIFLVLFNPNYQLDANVLAEADLGTSKLLYVLREPVKDNNGKIVGWPTNPNYWSRPCTSGRMPGDMRLLGGPVVAARGGQDSKAEVRILLWDGHSGHNASYPIEDLVRGTVPNVQGARVRIPGAARTTVDLNPKCMLVDLAGGEPVRDKEGHLTAPGMILVMDEFGNLVLHDEVVDGEEWDKATAEPEKPKEPGAHRPEVREHHPAPPEPGKDFMEGAEGNPVRSKRPGGH